MVDLTKLLDEAGRQFVAELSNNIANQTDINGDRFSPLKRSTLLARQRQKGLGRGLAVRLQTGAQGYNVRRRNRITTGTQLNVGLDRLLNTSKFWSQAFKYGVGPMDLTVGVSPAKHSGRVTFADIVRYNNQGSSRVNRNIMRPPLIFPNGDADIAKMKSFGKMYRKFNSPDVKQEILRMAAGGVTQSVKVDMKL